MLMLTTIEVRAEIRQAAPSVSCSSTDTGLVDFLIRKFKLISTIVVSIGTVVVFFHAFSYSGVYLRHSIQHLPSPPHSINPVYTE